MAKLTDRELRARVRTDRANRRALCAYANHQVSDEPPCCQKRERDLNKVEQGKRIVDLAKGSR